MIDILQEEARKEFLKNLIKTNERYKDFILLNNPISFNVFAGYSDIKTVQLHNITPCSDNSIAGFFGVCSWKNGKLTSLDGDSYSEKMLVYGYRWFEEEKENIFKGLDIFVEEW